MFQFFYWLRQVTPFHFTPADLKAFNYIKKRLQHRRSPVNIAKSLRTAFFMEHL